MKKLFLIRHAKSDWGHNELPDFERPLNKRGKHDAPFMAKILLKKNIVPDLVYSSPAVRAITTAKIFAEEIGFHKKIIIENEDIYEAGIRELENIVQNIPDEHKTVFLFGHNMTITSYANHLGDKFIDNMPTCSIVGIEFDMKNWKNAERGQGRIFLFEYPKKYLHKD